MGTIEAAALEAAAPEPSRAADSAFRSEKRSDNGAGGTRD